MVVIHRLDIVSKDCLQLRLLVLEYRWHQKSQETDEFFQIVLQRCSSEQKSKVRLYSFEFGGHLGFCVLQHMPLIINGTVESKSPQPWKVIFRFSYGVCGDDNIDFIPGIFQVFSQDCTFPWNSGI